jgi:hypothetical protein
MPSRVPRFGALLVPLQDDAISSEKALISCTVAIFNCLLLAMLASVSHFHCTFKFFCLLAINCTVLKYQFSSLSLFFSLLSHVYYFRNFLL